jgi:enoyl-CoA hydratase
LTSFATIEKGLGPDGRIAVVRFDRGDGINALSPEALRQLTDAARSFEDDGATSRCSRAAQNPSAPDLI